MSVGDRGCWGKWCVAHQSQQNPARSPLSLLRKRSFKCRLPVTPKLQGAVVTCQLWLEVLSVAQGMSPEVLTGHGLMQPGQESWLFVREVCLLTGTDK